MAFQTQLKSVEDIERFRTKIIGLKIQLLAFQAYTIRKYADSIITDKIHERMRYAGFSEKIIEGTYLDNIELIGRKKVRLYFRSEYFAKTGFDVAVAREEGTDRHFIEPLSMINPFIEKPTALHGGNKWPYFSKGHWVDGILALYIVATTVSQMTRLLQEEYDRQRTSWIIKNLEGVAIAG